MAMAQRHSVVSPEVGEDGPSPAMTIQPPASRASVKASTSSGVWLSDDGRTYRAAEGVSLPPNLVEGPSGFVFASTSQRGRGDALDGFETRSLDGFRALTGGEVLYVPLLHEERTP